MVLQSNEFGRAILGFVFVLAGIAILTIGLKVVSVINGVFQSNSSSTTIIFVIFGAFFLLGGIFNCFSFRKVVATLDKTLATAVTTTRGIFGQSEKKCEISQINHVHLHDSWDSGIPKVPSGRSVPAENYRLVFIMQDGSEFPLDHPIAISRTSYTTVPSDRDRTLGQKISEFLGVPFQDEGGINKGSGSPF